MRCLADESVDKPIVTALRGKEHIVQAIVEMLPGLADEAVLDMARQAGAILLTADKDFGQWVFRHHRCSSGVILLRLAGLQPSAKAALVLSVIQEHSARLNGAFTVITPRRVRIRPRLL